MPKKQYITEGEIYVAYHAEQAVQLLDTIAVDVQLKLM